MTARPLIRIGYAAFAEAAPLLAAGELGSFARRGLRFSYFEEDAQAALRDKLAPSREQAEEAGLDGRGAAQPPPLVPAAAFAAGRRPVRLAAVSPSPPATTCRGAGFPSEDSIRTVTRDRPSCRRPKPPARRRAARWTGSAGTARRPPCPRPESFPFGDAIRRAAAVLVGEAKPDAVTLPEETAA